jgi:hypothetical protein
MEILLFERASEFSHSLGQIQSPSFVAGTAELASIADAGEAVARPSTVGHITAATGAPQRPDATADGGGACTGPEADIGSSLPDLLPARSVFQSAARIED